jgi:two-component system, cell cycle sensor histidine kinase and response regulator CckA
MAPKSPRMPTVLVVDDELLIRQLTRRILEAGGYEVTEASNGLDAIALLAGGAPLDLLIADLDMPELGGDEMVRRIRTTRPDLRVLYVTGHIDRLMDARPVLWDGEAFLDKPFSAAGLLEAASLILYGTTKKKA